MPSKVDKERNERLFEYVANLMALGFKAPQITPKAMEITEPAPLFADPTNRESCARIVRGVVKKVELEWAELQARLHPHATGSYIAKKGKFENHLWSVATSRTRTTVREYVVIDPVTNKPRRVKETVMEGPHPIVQAAAIRELGKTIDDIHTVLGVDVKGKHAPDSDDDALFRQTADELLQAHEDRKRQQLQESSIPVRASVVDDDDGGAEPRGGPSNTSVM